VRQWLASKLEIVYAGNEPCNLIRLESGPSANQHALEIFDEYEVDSGANGTLIAYELNSA